MPRKHNGHSKHPFQQLKRQLYIWTSPDGQFWNQIDYVLCCRKWRSSIQSAKIRTGADCGSDHELLIGKFRFKLKTVGKTTRSSRYDLYQILYDYIVEVTNRCKGLDLVERVPEELGQKFITFFRRQWSKPSQRKRKAKRRSGYLKRLCK